MMTCEEVRESAGEYALGALTPAELRAFEQHAEACPDCCAVIAQQHRAAAALLGLAPQRQPPAGLRASLMAAARPQRAGALAKFKAAWRGLAAPARAAIAVVAVLALAFGGAAAYGALQHASATADIAAVSNNPRAVSLAMYARPAAPRATGSIRFEPDGTRGVLWAHDLPALEANRAYQLWLVDASGKRDNGGVFRPTTSDGSHTLLIKSPRPFSSYVRFGISIEPSGGSPAPTGPGVLTTQL